MLAWLKSLTFNPPAWLGVCVCVRGRGLPTCTPSLKDLAKTLLFIDMRSADKVDLEGNAKQAAPPEALGEDAGQAQGPGPGQGEGIHDSLEDASVTMKVCSLHFAVPLHTGRQPGSQPLPFPTDGRLGRMLPEGDHPCPSLATGHIERLSLSMQPF